MIKTLDEKELMLLVLQESGKPPHLIHESLGLFFFKTIAP